MKSIGITGQQGFVGSYVYNRISLLKDEFSIVPFQDSFFDQAEALQNWVQQCDVIIHLAALNRHEDPQVIYNTNINLVKSLTEACRLSNHTPQILFSSSTQEERDNLYGQSKKKGRELLEKWSEETGAIVTGMIIPNVFGPFGKPFYNSVVATFCHQLCNGQTPSIEVDGYLKLIYVDELADVFIQAIRHKTNDPKMLVPYTSEQYVSGILTKLLTYKETYLEKGNMPELPDTFSINLFNTFRSYIDHAVYFPFKLTQHADNRGAFVEIVRLGIGGQVSFSTTHPGITRGNHFHTKKIERFTVIKGKALIQLRKYNTEEVLNFELDGNEPSYVDMPVWYTHNIKNVGEEELYTVFWINEAFDATNPDTYFEIV